jgi:hypothetical protein
LPEYVFGHAVHAAEEIVSRIIGAGDGRMRVSNVEIAFVAVSDVCVSFGLMDQKAVESWFVTAYGERFAGGLRAKSRLFKAAEVVSKPSDAVTYVRAFVEKIVNSGEMQGFWSASLSVRGTLGEFRRFMAEVRVLAERDVVKAKNVSPKNAAGVIIWLKMRELAEESGVDLMIGEEDLSRLLGVNVKQRTGKVLDHMKV